MKTLIVEKEYEENRIDSYLAKKDEDLSRVAIQRLIKEEKILVNGKKIKLNNMMEMFISANGQLMGQKWDD